jgi:hypothetical protein
MEETPLYAQADLCPNIIYKLIPNNTQLTIRRNKKH